MSLYAISAHMKKTSFRILRVSEVPRVILCVIAVNTLVHTAVCLLCVLGVNCHEWLLIHPYIAWKAQNKSKNLIFFVMLLLVEKSHVVCLLQHPYEGENKSTFTYLFLNSIKF